MGKRHIVGKLSFAFVTALTVEAVAASTPIFDSGPAVIQASSSTSFPDPSTVIFAHQGGIPYIISRTPVNGDWGWYKTSGHHHTIAGGYDGDPTALYIPGTDQILTCGHSATSPGYMFCTRLRKADRDHFPNVYGPDQVGVGTFYPGSNPVLVDGGLGVYLYLFARGTNNQIWYAVYTISTHSWVGWYQIPSPPGDTFASDPGAAATDSSDHVMVCARLQSNQQVACNKLYGGWGTWSTVQNQPATAFKPGMAKGYSSMLLFGVRENVSPNHDLAYTTSPTGGNAGLWGTYVAPVGGGYNLSSGPSVVVNRALPQPRALAAARGGDNAFWYIVGSPAANGDPAAAGSTARRGNRAG